MSERITEMAHETEGAEPGCSFCGKRNSQVEKLIAVPGIMICAECVARCAEIAREGTGGVQQTTRPTPRRAGVSRWLPLFSFGGKLPGEPTCDFCGKPGPDLVQPPSTLGTYALICSECVALCQDLVRGHLR
jgi:ATP-dependent Clp protease ATP-binding subunit ClpX